MNNSKENIDKILKLLGEKYHDTKPGLDHKNPYQLLVATILSAQCTDRQVNKITPALFERYPGPEDLAAADLTEVEGYVKSCGFYKTKSRNIIASCGILIDKFNGQVPADIDVLQTLPGVGRKTANVVASNAFGIDAIAVDTHVFRVSNRLGLADAKNVLDTEKQLMENIPKNKWSDAHRWLIYHGRQICNARRPKCESCFLSSYCPYFKNSISS
ncbi:MAG: endonuclease III [Clostridiales bacterium]|nr:endonuclease III [Clostridiales bacterium]